MRRFFPPLFRCLAMACLGGFFLPVTAHAWWNSDWTLRKKITIDTSSNGVPITDPIGTTVVLIRLSDLQFSAAKDDGSDIRLIAADDKTPLVYHLEKFDALMGEAFVWVKVPNLQPGAVTTFWLYYGNLNGAKPAPGAADAKGTYDADTTLVYHFADQTGQPPADTTSNGNNAQNAGLPDDGGQIGSGLRLDGKTLVTVPSSSSLTWTDSQPLTWSAWVNAAALQADAVIFSRRDGGRDFLVGLDNGVPFVDVNGTRSQGATALQAKTWHHLAVAADGGKITLFVDGTAAATLGASIPALSSASTIGGDAADANAGTTPFAGEMDELEISKVARPVGVIRFAALGQSQDTGPKLVAVGQDEQPPANWLSGAFGLFGVILKSVTIDGWVVIGILGIMSIISWYVMITKFFFLNFIQTGNKFFLAEWRHLALDLTALDHSESGQAQAIGQRAGPKVQRMIRHSPLYRIYHIGSEEISKRMAGNKVLSSRSIQAIRASLDSSYVHENHNIHDGMVFLTISIAGGPFMGLLGTVIGVMITFAAIAATGEVNISAIAPGLAAALVATVAGLLVAIPALLGYNYLVSRMKTVTSDLQVFIDEFVTKMAEFYSTTSE
ncbi:MAG: DUF2341 domain-containing protein [Methylacidiphilales bacterium]|nr:DUF2341 domain-containing protein [Candidatus Methylacidiphilales bacterium]